MKIDVSSKNGRVPVTIMHIDGNIDSSTYGEFQAKTEELIKNGARHILIDLAHSPFVSSAGLRAFHIIFKELNSLHPDANLSEEEIKKGISDGSYKSPYFKLLNISDETKIVLKTSGFDMYIETYNDPDKAIASF